MPPEAVDARRFTAVFLFLSEALSGKTLAAKHTNSWNPKRAIDLYPEVWLESVYSTSVLLKLWFRHTHMKLLLHEDILLFNFKKK